ncbi:MAG: sporulation protein [Corynebacteriales bacterium]|nr:sporulation protein [Mycobacteriales bacterium]
MVFKKLFGVLGAGGASVDTVLTGSDYQPGAIMSGEVHVETTRDAIVVGRVTLVGVITSPNSPHTHEFGRFNVAHRFPVTRHDTVTHPLTFELPWETPLTSLPGLETSEVTVGVKTELAIDNGVDQTDLDPLSITPLPAQHGLLVGLSELNYRVEHNNINQGHLARTEQTLPFFQHLSFQHRASHKRLHIGCVATHDTLDVLLELGDGSGLTRGGGSTHQFRVRHDEAARVPWANELSRWLHEPR